MRVRCESCRAEMLLAFSCKRRGWCPSRGARRMADTAALLVDEALPEVPVRQWMLSVPIPLRVLARKLMEGPHERAGVGGQSTPERHVGRAGERISFLPPHLAKRPGTPKCCRRILGRDVKTTTAR